ncbi:hypothetical protein PTSG_08116 [Salpingoeca rosetta]|uniref:Uncharacterized protein n=1 Tax=Salpingoeca rosetta (strain ATCC 50818 / BSB-021) TaxID=946362 RepID=F2UI15_SALR5|nr:uncharacterized protein PTSG_08116 [Salpingoeca rosetta]EGD76764.1 hypothetical protein PTSG_08116 [Salpingoeca rosetta]|eukprot:XP_004991136.1 hypothetical protein PTSG_08116 [Salpingoeca rosetta]
MDLRLMMEASNAEDLEQVAPQLPNAEDYTYQRVARHKCHLCGAATLPEPKNQRLINDRLKILMRNPSVEGSLLISHNGIKFQDAAGRKKPLIIGLHRVVYSVAHASKPYVSVVISEPRTFKCIGLRTATLAEAQQLNNDLGAAFEAAYRNKQLRVRAGHGTRDGGSYRFERKPSNSTPFAAATTTAPLSAEQAMEAIEAGFTDRGWVAPARGADKARGATAGTSSRNTNSSSSSGSSSSSRNRRSGSADRACDIGAGSMQPTTTSTSTSINKQELERQLGISHAPATSPPLLSSSLPSSQAQQQQQQQHRSGGRWSVASTRESPTQPRTTPPPPLNGQRRRAQSAAQSVMTQQTGQQTRARMYTGRDTGPGVQGVNSAVAPAKKSETPQPPPRTSKPRPVPERTTVKAQSSPSPSARTDDVDVDSADVIVRSRASSQRRQQLSSTGPVVLPHSTPRALMHATPDMACATFKVKVMRCHAISRSPSLVVADYLVADANASASLRCIGGTLDVGKTYVVSNCSGAYVHRLFYVQCNVEDAKECEQGPPPSSSSSSSLSPHVGTTTPTPVLERGLLNMTSELSQGTPLVC